MLTDVMQDLEELRKLINDIALADVLHRQCDEELLKSLDSVVLKYRSSRTTHFGYILGPRIAEQLTEDGNAWLYLQSYCGSRLDDDIIAPAHLLECLLYIYEPKEAGAWIGNNVLAKREPKLQFDKDNLLIGPVDKITFKKQGVLTDQHFILYNSMLPGTWLVGGFVDELLKTAFKLSPEKLGLSVKKNSVLSRDHYFPYITKAYIRGPRGLSESILTDPNFPEDPSGTVTVHKRLGDHPLYQLFPLDRLEVMWSRKGDHKTIQIEELVDPSPINPRSKTKDGVINRYIHARWNINNRKFSHFDGAVRIYKNNLYEQRLGTDIKKCSTKPNYQKLFRLDAPLDLQSWCDLTSRFYYENELVCEYLGGAEDDYL